MSGGQVGRTAALDPESAEAMLGTGIYRRVRSALSSGVAPSNAKEDAQKEAETFEKPSLPMGAGLAAPAQASDESAVAREKAARTKAAEAIVDTHIRGDLVRGDGRRKVVEDAVAGLQRANQAGVKVARLHCLSRFGWLTSSSASWGIALAAVLVTGGWAAPVLFALASLRLAIAIGDVYCAMRELDDVKKGTPSKQRQPMGANSLGNFLCAIFCPDPDAQQKHDVMWGVLVIRSLMALASFGIPWSAMQFDWIGQTSALSEQAALHATETRAATSGLMLSLDFFDQWLGRERDRSVEEREEARLILDAHHQHVLALLAWKRKCPESADVNQLDSLKRDWETRRYEHGSFPPAQWKELFDQVDALFAAVTDWSAVEEVSYTVAGRKPGAPPIQTNLKTQLAEIAKQRVASWDPGLEATRSTLSGILFLFTLIGGVRSGNGLYQAL